MQRTKSKGCAPIRVLEAPGLYQSLQRFVPLAVADVEAIKGMQINCLKLLTFNGILKIGMLYRTAVENAEKYRAD